MEDYIIAEVNINTTEEVSMGLSDCAEADCYCA